MAATLDKLLNGYQAFRSLYTSQHNSLMKMLAKEGQAPNAMMITCSDSRIDPALLLQSQPGDIFTVRNVANIVPPYEKDEAHHGTSAALEFGICCLKVKHLIILGHSQCGGIHAHINKDTLHQNDFISHWMDVLDAKHHNPHDIDGCAKDALLNSYRNCLGFPWIKQRLDDKTLQIHLWFFDIATGTIEAYQHDIKTFKPLDQ